MACPDQVTVRGDAEVSTEDASVTPDSHVAAIPVSKTRSTLLGGGLIKAGHRDVGAFLGQPGGTGPASAMCARSTVGLCSLQWRNPVPELGPCGRTWVRSVFG